MVDVVVTGRGHDARAAVRPGGSAAIAAAWAAEAGAEATVVGSIGDDFAGRALRSALELQGVTCLLSVDDEAPTGTFLLVDGEIRTDRGANARLTPDELPERIEADGVLVSGYLPPDTVAAALERADARWIALSPGPLEQVPPGADALFLNGDEAQRLTGEEPEDAARALGERFRLACVTRGPEGAVAVLGGGLRVATTRPVLEPALGAGDAFAATTIVALSGGAGLDDALAAGCEAGARAADLGPWPAG
jgi:sugar/nucleoside kinase (ribokinase family)